MREIEAKLECLKLAVAIKQRDGSNSPDDMIALSTKLCDHVLGGSSGGGKTTSPSNAKKSG